MLKINELFWSIQCEGHHTGLPAIFIRLADCNLKCSFCDTDFSIKYEITEEEIIKEIDQYPCSTVVITGGEPLLQDLDKLVEELHGYTYDVHLETNGTVEVEWTMPSYRSFDWITVSPKSKIEHILLERWDEVKLIVNELTDEKEIREKVKQLQERCDSYIYLQPCWYANDEKRTKESIQNTILLTKIIYPCRLSIQGQKFIGIR